MTEETCNSCKSRVLTLEGSTNFKCPSCSKEEIVRCDRCRKIAAKYKCSKCGFSGPN